MIDQKHAEAQDAGQDARHEIRAGPGDAGASDAPRVLPKTDRYRKRTRQAGSFTIGIVAAGALVVVLLWILF